MFRLIAINFSQKSPHFSPLSPTSPCELSEREVTSPSNLQGSPHIVKTGRLDFSLSWLKGEILKVVGAQCSSSTKQASSSYNQKVICSSNVVEKNNQWSFNHTSKEKETDWSWSDKLYVETPYEPINWILNHDFIIMEEIDIKDGNPHFLAFFTECYLHF